jgi:hypothetical protein
MLQWHPFHSVVLCVVQLKLELLISRVRAFRIPVLNALILVQRESLLNVPVLVSKDLLPCFD